MSSVKMTSKTPRNAAVMREIMITITVKAIA